MTMFSSYADRFGGLIVGISSGVPCTCTSRMSYGANAAGKKLPAE
jgi:hypothetical protein